MSKYFSFNNFPNKFSFIQTRIRLFSTRVSGSNKSIYNKSLNITKENTIDITSSTEEMNKNIKLELKNLEKSSPSNSQTKKEEFNFTHEKDLYENENISEPKFNQQTYNSINKDYNFDNIKERNKEIQKKGKTLNDKKSKKDKTQDEDDEDEDKKYIDEKTLAKLQELIKNDKDSKSTQYKPINPEDGEEVSQTTSTENEKELLVNRPAKNFVWGLGNQTKQKKFKFIEGEYPTVDSIVTFLEINNLNEIIVVPTHELGLIHLKENAIICSGHTAKHTYKAAKDLVVEIKKLKIPNLPFVPTVFGRRDQPWNLVEIGNITIHFFVESYRDEIDLLGRWTNPPPEEFLEWQRRLDAKYYGKKKI